MLTVLFALSLAGPVEIHCDAAAGIRVCRELPVEEGGLLVAEVSGCDNPELEWRRKPYSTHSVGDGKWHGLMPVPLNAPEGAHLLRARCGARSAGFVVHVVPGDYESSELRVGRRFSKPPPPRVEGEREAISVALHHEEANRLWTQPFEIPRIDEITSPFGVRRVFNKVLQSQHRGLDIDGRIGTEIRAANDGVVVLAARNFFYVGNAVFLHHGQQLYSMYFHLSTLDVDTGDRVKRGQLIGAVGRTGRVTGPHLHFSVKLRGFYIDPVDVMAYRPAPMEAPLQVEGRRIVKRLGRR